jgi:hypothetical protein
MGANGVMETVYVKVISPNIEQFMTPVALAVMICADGSWSGNGVYIATDCFKLNEVIMLIDILKRQFGLVATHQVGNRADPSTSDQYRLYIHAKSMPTLRILVLPYMPRSMWYKLGVELGGDGQYNLPVPTVTALDNLVPLPYDL